MEITFHRKELEKRYQRYPHIFDRARPRYGTADTARHRPTSETEMSDTEPEVEIAAERKVLAMRFQRLPHIFDTARLKNGTADTARHRPTSENPTRRPRNRKWKQEVKIGNGNNFRTEGGGEKISTATPTFSTVPDLYMTLPTQPDIGGHGKPKMSAMKPEVEPEV